MQHRERLAAKLVSICFVILGLSLGNAASPPERQPTRCVPDSPERRGLEGCTILASRPLNHPATPTLYWHVDRYGSLRAAEKAARPDSVAVEAHGAVWLLTVEERNEQQHGGRHVAWIGPFVLPRAERYTMRVQSTLLMPGGFTPPHTHSGPEVFYVYSGAQCVETASRAHRLIAGRSLVVPADTAHRGRVLGSIPRRALALVLHDASRPPSTDLAAPPRLTPCTQVTARSDEAQYTPPE